MVCAIIFELASYAWHTQPRSLRPGLFRGLAPGSFFCNDERRCGLGHTLLQKGGTETFKVPTLLAVLTVATACLVGGFTAYATHNGFGVTPEARNAASDVTPVHGMMGGECIWYKGCKYCRYSADSQWML